LDAVTSVFKTLRPMNVWNDSPENATTFSTSNA